MPKTLEEHLAKNPKAKRHERVIRDTLTALEKLRAAGFADSSYDLEPPYGGSREPQDPNARKTLVTGKMNYCA